MIAQKIYEWAKIRGILESSSWGGEFEVISHVFDQNSEIYGLWAKNIAHRNSTPIILSIKSLRKKRVSRA